MSLTTLDRAVWPAGRGPTWLPTSDGFAGKYGSVQVLVVTDEHGKARHDRPIYTEAPHFIMVPWGYHPQGVKIGLIKESRPTAGCVDVNDSPIFWGVPRGFVDQSEDAMQAARRELAEEAGAVNIRNLMQIGEINPNPSCFNSWGPVFSAEVSLDTLSAIAPTRDEKIFKAKFFFAYEVMEMISRREHDGALLSDGVSLAALMQFFAYYPSVMQEASQL